MSAEITARRAADLTQVRGRPGWHRSGARTDVLCGAGPECVAGLGSCLPAGRRGWQRRRSRAVHALAVRMALLLVTALAAGPWWARHGCGWRARGAVGGDAGGHWERASDSR